MIKANEMGRCDVTRHALAQIEAVIASAPRRVTWLINLKKQANLKKIKSVMSEAGYEIQDLGFTANNMKTISIALPTEIITIETCFDVDVDLQIKQGQGNGDEFISGLKQAISEYIQDSNMAISYRVREVER